MVSTSWGSPSVGAGLLYFLCLANAASSASLMVRHLHPRPALVIGLHQRPRVRSRCWCGRPCRPPLRCRSHLSRLPVFLGDLVAFERDLLAPSKRSSWVCWSMDSQNLTTTTRRSQLLFEVVDLAVGAHPVGRAAEAFDPLHQHPAIPGAVEDGELAAPECAARSATGTAGRAPPRWARQSARCGTAAGRAPPPPGGSPRPCPRRRCLRTPPPARAAHALVTQQAGQARLLGDQLFFVVAFVQAQGQVQRPEQALRSMARPSAPRCLMLALGVVGQRSLQAFSRMRPTARLR
jgi:hypothetical protein